MDTRAEIHDSIEQAILDVAERLFLEKGFDQTSTTEIARVVGCNQAMVHYYFRKKERLFQQVFRKKLQLFASAFFSISEEKLPIRVKLTKWIETHFDILAAHPKLPLFLVNEVAKNPERVNIKAVLNEYRLPLATLANFERDLQESISQGEVRPIRIEDLVMNMLFLNAALFLIKPMIEQIFDLDEEAWIALRQSRKQEHVRMVLASLSLNE